MAQQVLWDYRMIKQIWIYFKQPTISISWVLHYMDFYSITQKINPICYIINGIPLLQIKSSGLTLIWIIDGFTLLFKLVTFTYWTWNWWKILGDYLIRCPIWFRNYLCSNSKLNLLANINLFQCRSMFPKQQQLSM